MSSLEKRCGSSGNVRGARREPGERTESRAKDVDEPVRRHRKIEGGDRQWRTRCWKGDGVDHLLDWRDAGDRLGRKCAKGIGDGADEPAVDVDGASAHALNDSCPREGTALETCQDQASLGTVDVVEDTDHVNSEFLTGRAFEDRHTDADHSGLHLCQRHPIDRGGRRYGERSCEQPGSKQWRFHRVTASARRREHAWANRSFITVEVIERQGEKPISAAVQRRARGTRGMKLTHCPALLVASGVTPARNPA